MGTLNDIRTSDFHFFLKTVAERFSSVAIFNLEFKCLHIHTPHSNNAVGLMQGFKTLKSFFSWDGTQVVIHNDSLLGCSQSNRIQFLFSAESFHFSIEEAFPLNWDFSKKVIKIPPIPIIENNRVNRQLLDTLTSQGDCPSSLRDLFQTTFKKIERFQIDFKNAIRVHDAFASKELHKDYLALAGASTLKTIKSKTYASSQVEYEFEAQSLLKIKIMTSELGVRIDFQGTTNNSSLQLADYTTDSICFHFFADYFQFSDLMNESTYSNFQIAKPTHSFVNSKVFTNKLHSDLCGPDLINQALIDCISDRMILKPYLALKPYFQFADAAGAYVEFSIANAKPIGSIGVAYQYEPLLCSRPYPGGGHIPTMKEFNSLGLEVLSSQNLYRSPKAKDTNDFQVQLQVVCIRPLSLTVANPLYPLKIKVAKNQSTIVRPTLSVNGEKQNQLVQSQDLKPDDKFEFKSGVLDFP